MLIKWGNGDYSVVVDNDDGNIKVWHPSNPEDIRFTVFSNIYNKTEDEIRKEWELNCDNKENVNSLVEWELGCNILNEFEVARDMN
ncbi:MAG: hypothetical protein AAGA80_22350 [Cyanobacteria bacterium P01_F01_bin.143]